MIFSIDEFIKQCTKCLIIAIQKWVKQRENVCAITEANYFSQYFFMLDLCSHQKKSDKTMIWQKNLPTVQVHLELRNFHGYLGNSNSKIKFNKIKNLRLSLYSEQRQSSIVSIWVQRWCKGWLVKCLIYLQKTSTIKERVVQGTPMYQEFLPVTWVLIIWWVGTNYVTRNRWLAYF